MNIDLNQVENKTVPAVEAKEFPLAFMRLLHAQASSPEQVRAYAEFCPYRRITNADGTVIGSEFKTPEVDGDITVIEHPNIMALAQTDEAGSALIEQTIGAFAMQGGNVAGLAFACLLLAFKQEGINQGKFLP